MGFKHWNKESLPDFELDRHVERLEEAMRLQEKRKKADKERLENIKYCYVRYREVSGEDLSWLIMKAGKGME